MRRIEELERERLILSQKPKETPPPAAHVGTALERIIPVLKNPYQTWKDGDTHSKRLVTCLVFPSRLPYVRNEGFGTAEIALPFLLLASPDVTVSTLVDYRSEAWNQLFVWLFDHSTKLGKIPLAKRD